MMPRPQIIAIVALVLTAFLGVVWLRGGTVPLEWATYLGITMTLVSGVLFIFDRWFWRFPLLQGWFVKRPHLWGTWSVTFATQWKDPETGRQREPVSGTFEIRQSFSSLHVRMQSDQSNGDLLCANILNIDDGRFRLAGIYRNEPKLNERQKSGIHYGTFLLDIEGNPNSPTGMRGNYWTDRETKGEMNCARGIKRESGLTKTGTISERHALTTKSASLVGNTAGNDERRG